MNSEIYDNLAKVRKVCKLWNAVILDLYGRKLDSYRELSVYMAEYNRSLGRGE